MVGLDDGKLKGKKRESVEEKERPS